MSTKFFTNHNGNSVLKKFKGAFEHIANIYAFHAVVGYFRASGYYAIREHLMKVPEVKILVGINVDVISAEAKRRGLLFFGDAERTRDEFIKWMRQDIKEASYTKEVEDGILQFMEDIIDKKIQIRVHKTKKLHAKIYIFLPQNFNEYSGGEVITGSSNLTSAGLGVEDVGNYEFNVALRDYDDVAFAEKEFAELWKDGEEILPIDIDRIRHKSHIGQLFTPFELYIKFLIEYFGKNIDYDPDTVGDLPRNFKKLSYQIDAVNQGYQMILDHNGFILADVVGLGKTVIASMIAKRFLIANGTLSTKILVVFPPPLEKNWKTTFRYFGLDKHTRFISNGSLHKVLKDNEDYWPKEDYDLILVDEAHKFRNHRSIMFDNLQTICKAPRSIIGNVSGYRKKVVLISATPLNNRPDDIYYQLQLFQDARKSTLPVTNLQSFFAPLIRKYKEIIAGAKLNGKPDVAALRTIYGDIRNKVLEPITVRRTRTDVKNYPAYLKDLEEQGIRFPDIAPPKAVEYELGPELEALFYNTIACLVDEIGYYRYQAIAYLLPEIQDKYYSQAERVSKTLAQIMMTQMVKRLESSFYAFKKSLERFRISTQRMIDMFAKGKIYVAPSTNVNALMDQDWTDEQIEERILELSAEDPKNQIFTPQDFDEEFIDLLRADLAHITKICGQWDEITEDPKLDLFKQLLKNELFRNDINKTGKLVIFTESKETADYLTKQLHYPKTLTVSADNRKAVFDAIQKNFDANYNGDFQDDYNIIISTEVLAEGVNLHRSNIIVNYDTPWNATRLMQRIGRVNRIGSVADVIYNYAFYPSRQSDKLINLYNNAYIKLQGFHTAFGEDSRIYTVEEVLEQVKLHTQGVGEEEDKRLIYLRFIREFKEKNEKEFRRIKNLPLKARTGRKPGKKHKTLQGSSLIFMKSPYKTEFYKVDNRGKIEALTFIQAAELFEATITEVSEALPDYHHAHIEKASAYFEQELFSNSVETVSGEQADAKTNGAKKFIRELRADSRDEKFRNAAETILLLLDKGTITNLPNELNKLRLKYNKGDIKAHAAENLVMQLAAKYMQQDASEEDADVLDAPPLPFEITQKPDIILSETFQSHL
ncbi:helicase [Ilyomonas limi]|uniref:Helicase n=1 Tax=Ilyomonas limi TaxID=2575867 RepID=A0A4U3L5E4_9BACT|nr:helicase-related protein [Ilyomonas limi]TKK70220.1 helicase [Ilyomonas limi]